MKNNEDIALRDRMASHFSKQNIDRYQKVIFATSRTITKEKRSFNLIYIYRNLSRFFSILGLQPQYPHGFLEDRHQHDWKSTVVAHTWAALLQLTRALFNNAVLFFILRSCALRATVEGTHTCPVAVLGARSTLWVAGWPGSPSLPTAIDCQMCNHFYCPTMWLCHRVFVLSLFLDRQV